MARTVKGPETQKEEENKRKQYKPKQQRKGGGQMKKQKLITPELVVLKALTAHDGPLEYIQSA